MSSATAPEILKLIQEEGPLAQPLGLEELRLAFSKFYLGFETPRKLSLQEVLIGRQRATWIAVPEVEPHRTVLFFHGGGYTVGSVRDHQELCARLSAAARARVLSLEYRLAPENPYPAAMEDCLQAALWLLERGLPPQRLALAGLSVGGSLALTTLLALRERGSRLPAAGVCLSPAPDLTFPGQSMQANQGRDWLTPQRLENIRVNYLAGADPSQPMASPIAADLTGLPPLMIQAGGGELLLDDIRALAAKAKEAGVETTLEEYPEMFHAWQMFASRLDQGQEAIASAGAFIRKMIP